VDGFWLANAAKASAMNNWWGLNECAASNDGRLRSCSSPAMLYGYYIRDVDVPDNGAHIEFDEGWGMVTGPKFGCVNHEPLDK
jgi:hypothetical protein